MAMVQATLAHVAVGCNAASNALSVRPNSDSASSASCNYSGAFAAKNVVCLLRSDTSSADDDTNAAPLAIAHTLKHRDAASEASRITSVTLQCDAQSGSARVLAGDSEGRVFLWSKASGGDWQLRKLSDDAQKLPAVTVAAVATAATQKRRLHFVAFSDGTLAVFGESKDSEEVPLLSRLELGVKSIMETVDAFVLRGDGGEQEESVLLATGGVDAKVHLFEVAGGSDRLTQLLALEGHRGWIRSVAFKQRVQEEAGRAVVTLASASQDQRIRVWKVSARSRGVDEAAASGEVKDGHVASGDHTTYTVSFDALLVGHEDWVTSVQWTELPQEDESEDSRESALLSSSMDNTLIVWTKSADTRSSWTPSLRVGEMGGNGLLSAGPKSNALSLGQINGADRKATNKVFITV
ncbi:Elongator complex protein [Phytophthora cinnamomi]|uniref:Elongator complex protein n=1 Tax=Phytophthora cinnamomi TaxID=4785 RepID=UPI00355A770A|nr:Elongator complex protein [Phytophthora cinnamomi]